MEKKQKELFIHDRREKLRKEAAALEAKDAADARLHGTTPHASSADRRKEDPAELEAAWLREREMWLMSLGMQDSAKGPVDPAPPHDCLDAANLFLPWLTLPQNRT